MKKVISYLLIFAILVCCSMNVEAKQKSYDVIVCGDSRVVGLAAQDGLRVYDNKVNGENNGKSIYYIAEVGKGYYWFKNNLDTLKDKCTKDTVVYIALGVNDLYNKNRYIDLYNELSDKLNGAKIIVSKVGSVNEEKESKYGYSIKQSDVKLFNKSLLKSADNYKVIDLWYGDESKETIDGIHYNSKEYNKSLSKLKESL